MTPAKLVENLTRWRALMREIIPGDARSRELHSTLALELDHARLDAIVERTREEEKRKGAPR
jgi:hypothetical protein